MKWHRDIGLVAGSSTIVNWTVYVGGAAAVHAVNVSTGGVEWSQSVDGSVRAPVAVTGDTVYAATTDGTFVGLGTAEGVSRTPVDLENVTPTSVVVSGETAYVGTWDGQIRAVETA